MNMLSETERNQIIAKYEQYCYKQGIASDLFDINAKIDSSLSVAENINLIFEDLEGIHKTSNNMKKEIQQQKARIEFEKNTAYNAEGIVKWTQSLCHKSVVCGVLGSRGSGKSCLVFYLLDLHHLINPSRKLYFYKFPKPSLLPSHIQNINSFEEAEQGSLIAIDEASIEFSQFSFRDNKSIELSNYIKTARHKDISLFIITQNGQTLTRDIRRLIDFYLLRNPSQAQLYDEISIIKRMYQNCFMLFSTETAKKKGFFITDIMEFCTFDLPIYWNEQLSKAYNGKEEHINLSNLFNTSFQLGNTQFNINITK